MKLSVLIPSTLTIVLALPHLTLAVLESTRVPSPGEFEPFRLQIGADSDPEFVSSRYNPNEIPSNKQTGLGGDVVDDDDDALDAGGRAVAATLDIEISEVQKHTDMISDSVAGKRVFKIIAGQFKFVPPMKIVDVKVDGGPSDLVNAECYLVTKTRGGFIKFGLGQWISGSNVRSVYCAGYYAAEWEEV